MKQFNFRPQDEHDLKEWIGFGIEVCEQYQRDNPNDLDSNRQLERLKTLWNQFNWLPDDPRNNNHV